MIFQGLSPDSSTVASNGTADFLGMFHIGYESNRAGFIAHNSIYEPALDPKKLALHVPEMRDKIQHELRRHHPYIDIHAGEGDEDGRGLRFDHAGRPVMRNNALDYTLQPSDGAGTTPAIHLLHIYSLLLTHHNSLLYYYYPFPCFYSTP